MRRVLKAIGAVGRGVLGAGLKVLRVTLLLLLVIIPIPMTFAWMKRLVGDRRNLPSETLKKD